MPRTELAEIIRIQQEIATTLLDLDGLMSLVCERAQLLTGAEGAVVELAEGDEMVYRAASGNAAPHLGLRLKIASSLSGTAVLSAQVLHCEDSETDPRVDREACRRIGVRSMIVVPLIRPGRRNQAPSAIGVLKVMGAQARAFNEEDVDLLRLMAGLLSASIGHAHEQQERERAQRELERRNAELLDATRAKSEFLANMSHEIRTPINGVMGMASLLLGTGLTAEQREYADGVRVSAEALLTLVNDILDFSKIEARKVTLESIDFDLRQLFADLVRTVSLLASQKGLALAQSVDDGVPVRVKGDPTRLRQVLLNLTSNAIKFTDRGQVRVEASLERLSPAGSLICFVVRDTGIGIPREALGRMFQAFTQADSSTTRRYGGTGLGLSICRHLVELMGGEIGVESEPGRGSTFWCTIPFQAAAAPTAPPPAAPDLAGGLAAAPAARLRVLIAEDNAINQVIARKMVEKLGHEAVVAEDGGAALDALRAGAFDVVLMDCQMPGMDGFQATREIRAGSIAGREQVWIIALTANAMTGDRERCLEAGMDDYLSKPMKAAELAEVLSRMKKRAPGA